MNRVDIALTISVLFIITAEIWFCSGSMVWRAGLLISRYLLL
ncbi:MAG: hypothetical protein ACRCZ6_13825 [Kluyvera sp.]